MHKSLQNQSHQTYILEILTED